MDFFERWHRTSLLLDRAPPEGVIEQLLAAYGEPHRAYHTAQHLLECLAHLDGCPCRPEDPAALELALWFHDAVYDPDAGDNEARSAALAREQLSILDASMLDRIERLILVTRHDAAPTDADQELLLDLDLSILGADLERFEEYEAQIRQEYSRVPEDEYRKARAEVLSGFLERPALYHRKHFRALLEDRARVNLRRSLRALRPG